MAAKVILVEAHPRDPATAEGVELLLAGGGWMKPYHYFGSHWQAGVAGLPTIISSLDWSGEDLGTGGVPQAARIVWQPPQGASIDDLAALVWRDAAITVRIGPEGAQPPIALAGTVLEATCEPGALTISLADPAITLKKPVPAGRYAGTGGLEGPAEWDGRLRRRVWGRVWNIAGEPIDKANNIYALADPARPIQSIDAVRDMGANAAALTTLAWAGSTAATFAALQAAVAPQGGGVICPSIACVKWWTQPGGDLTADLKGEIGTGYVETSAEIAQRLVAELGGPVFGQGEVARAAALRPGAAGWVVKDDTTEVSAMLDELLGNVSLLWVLGADGRIALREWAWGKPVRAGTSDKVQRKRTFRPVVSRTLGWRRNETQMQRGDLAAIVLAGDVAFTDGTILDTLQPAEAGADVTSEITGAAEITINANYLGAVVETLPRTQPYVLNRNGADVTTAAAWSVSVLSGTIAASIGAATGVLSLNTSSGTLTSAVLRLQADYGATARTFDVRVTKANAAAPSSGSGGGGSASGNVFGSTSSTVMTWVGDELTVTVGSGGQANLSAEYWFDTGSGSGSYGEYAQWYRWDGAAWVPLGTETAAATPYVPASGESGYGACTRTVTGLTASSSQKFRLYMRNASGTVTRNIYGNLAAVGS